MERKLAELLGAQERPSLTRVHRALAEWCEHHDHRAPSRATVYNAVRRMPVPTYELADLPECVQQTLHNVGGPRVPGNQIVFAAFNYGDTDALSYAASLPWLCLEHAMTMRGFRPKSLALLRALAVCRGIRE